MELVIVTGISGAGKSSVMNSLEDVGYFCIDNLPAKLIPVFSKLLIESAEHTRVAVVTDIRAGLTLTELSAALSRLDEMSVSYRILFLECSEDVLISRYKLTRRIHPLMKDANDTLSSAILSERNILSPVRDIAHYILDTTDLSLSDCRMRINSMFSSEGTGQMHIHCMSFGFKHKAPKDADFVFDVRFLPNPYYIPELKELNGLNEKVRDFVMSENDAVQYEKHIKDMMSFVIPRCINEGRRQLVIAIGCTGGHHRSVTFAERLYKFLTEEKYSVSVSHRDISK